MIRLLIALGFSAILLQLAIQPAQAASSSTTFSIPDDKPANLLRETQTLRLQDEVSVQEPVSPTHNFVHVLAGLMQPTFLEVSTGSQKVSYDFSAPMPLFTVVYDHYFNREGWRWGVSTSAGYAFKTYNSSLQSTALHLIPINVSALYRYEKNTLQKYIPYFKAGPTLTTYVQRGVYPYNTSGTSWALTGAAGISVNLNRMSWYRSRNEAELLVQLSQTALSGTGTENFNGTAFQLGGTLAL